jgi:hypothetical protein
MQRLDLACWLGPINCPPKQFKEDISNEDPRSEINGVTYEANRSREDIINCCSRHRTEGLPASIPVSYLLLLWQELNLHTIGKRGFGGKVRWRLKVRKRHTRVPHLESATIVICSQSSRLLKKVWPPSWDNVKYLTNAQTNLASSRLY